MTYEPGQVIEYMFYGKIKSAVIRSVEEDYIITTKLHIVAKKTIEDSANELRKASRESVK